jgi:hypothetical protein
LLRHFALPLDAAEANMILPIGGKNYADARLQRI